MRMDSATRLPLVAVCDNGFGGLSNVVRTVREFERMGIAGICVEDDVFPRRNSLYEGESRRDLIPLASRPDRSELARKLRRRTDASSSPGSKRSFPATVWLTHAGGPT